LSLDTVYGCNFPLLMFETVDVNRNNRNAVAVRSHCSVSFSTMETALQHVFLEMTTA